MANRPNILKLATKISLESLTYTGITYKDPEYRILAPIVDDDMCRVMMHMRLETNRTVEDIAKRCHESEAFVQEQIDKLIIAGIVRSRKVGACDCYYYPIWVPGIIEGILTNKEQCERYPDIGYCFEEYARRRPEMVAPAFNSGKLGMFMMRVMPVMSAIENNTKTASYDEIATLIENATAISVGPCSCRRSRRLMGEGCGHLEEDMCMYLNDNAINYSKTGAHRLITKEEAYEVLRRAEDNGLVHEINQTPGFEEASAICNCCGCSCYALRIAEMFRSKNAIRSNYVARVDKEKCVACGQCVENCQTNAIRLGQKNCTTNPHISDAYDTDRAIPWDKSSYNVDYRTNRSDVMESGTAPCKATCPAHIPVQGYIKLASEGRYQEALELIKKENPFPAVCGRICNKRCEEACTRGTIDQAVAIDAVKKFLAEQDLNAETRYIPPVVIASNRLEHWAQKIAIIGSGPAGLSAAYYLATKGYKPTVFEKSAKPGGMLTYGIPSFKLEKNIIDAEVQVIRELGVEIKCGVEVGKDVTIPELRKQGYEAFYIAIGCQGGRRPGVANDTAKGTSIAVEFLHHALEDENQKMEGNVVVVGGGNVAVDCAKTAKRFGAAKVSMVCLEDRATMPASNNEIAETLEENIEINNSWGPKELKVDENGHVTAIVFKKCLRTIDPETKRFSPVYDEHETMELAADHVVFAIGQAIEWGGLLEGTKVEFWRGNYPVADPLTYQTAEPDIFVGGDVYHGPKFAIDAIEEGKCAAESLHRYVHKGADMKIGRNRRDFIMLDKDNISVSGYDHAGRQEAGMDESIPNHSFRDAHKTLTAEQVKIETARCLGCGASWVDPNKCIGCGVCTTRCVFDAIHLKRDHPECSKMMKAEDKVKGIIPMAGKRLGQTIVTKLGGKKD